MVEASEQPREILVAEDNPADAVLLRKFLKCSEQPCRLHVVPDGEAALAFLRQEGGYADRPRPHLILLDVGLPKMSGWAVLGVIRATPALTTIPVVMLTGGISPEDAPPRAALRPAAYLEKPMSYRGYLRLAEALEKLMRQTPLAPPASQGDGRITV